MPSKQLENFGKALAKLREMLARDSADEAVRDASIQRFEFTYETCWKALKHQLAEEGIPTDTPKDVFRKAYQAGWLQHEAPWLAMLKDRNLTSHIYHEALAIAIYGRLTGYLSELEDVHTFLQRRASQP
jgi:nucleotidyltransferase substrate binding protein (TIGR01987 family)